MEILYIGSLCDEEWFSSTHKKNGLPSRVAQYNFEKALMEGFIENDIINIDVNYLYQEDYFPKGNHLLFRKKVRKLNKKLNVNYLSYINIPFVKEIYLLIKGIILTLQWVKKHNIKREKLILTAFNYTPFSLGVLIASRLFKVKRINIFTDLSSDIINPTRQRNMSRIKRIILPVYMKLVNIVEKNFDGYVLFTELMNSKVNPYRKPSVVVEGIYCNDLGLLSVPKSRAIMYAGTLNFEYGVKNILDAFEQIEDPSLELWLFGDGDMRNYIEEITSIDPRVKYFGFMRREEVFEYEKKALLLLNVRDANDEFTKYSFPSKTFEYMASGTPFLTTKLECIPKEYYKYLYLADSSSPSQLKNIINEILSKPSVELDEIGNKAREFVLTKKNSKFQTEKIIRMIHEEILNNRNRETSINNWSSRGKVNGNN